MALCAAGLLAGVVLLLSDTPPAPFLEKPYLQLGDSPKPSAAESLVLLWHTENAPGEWAVEVRGAKQSKWRVMEKPSATTVSAPAGVATLAGKDGAKRDAPAPPAIEPHLVYRARLTGLAPGEEFHYRVLKAGAPVFESAGVARKSAAQPFRFVVFGDCAQGRPEQNAIAYQAYLAKPDFLFIPGDIVYSSGRISEYREKFYPTYNSDEASANTGAPLIRGIPFIAAPGNHDTDLNNYKRFPDALAYFLYWDQPLNGPVARAGDTMTSHVLTGDPAWHPFFLAGAQARYPRMANFSFDYGNTHWTVLDANKYMDWNQPSLREWVAKDLAGAQSAAFRFVGFHQPGFNSAREHLTDQWMRTLAPVFEKGNVDIVVSGHVHNYQRSFPMTFAPKPQPDGKPVGPKGEVAGDWNLDHQFGSGAQAKPRGVIYIISGGGGASLYNPEQQTDPASWLPFTDRFFSVQNSFSVVDIKGKTLLFRQISIAGKEVDSFQISK
jgi:hypothetical protein